MADVSILPDELLRAVLSHLSLNGLESAAIRVSRSWNRLAAEEISKRNGVLELAAQVTPMLTVENHHQASVGKYTRHITCRTKDGAFEWRYTPECFACIFYIIGELAYSCLLEDECCVRHCRLSARQVMNAAASPPPRASDPRQDTIVRHFEYLERAENGNPCDAAYARLVWQALWRDGAPAAQVDDAAWLLSSRRRTYWARQRLRAPRDLLAPMWWLGEVQCRLMSTRGPSSHWLVHRQIAGLRILIEAALGRSSWDPDGRRPGAPVDFYDMFHPHGNRFDRANAFSPYERVHSMASWDAIQRCKVCRRLPPIPERARRSHGDAEDEQAAPVHDPPPPSPQQQQQPPQEAAPRRRLTVADLLSDRTYSDPGAGADEDPGAAPEGDSHSWPQHTCGGPGHASAPPRPAD